MILTDQLAHLADMPVEVRVELQCRTMTVEQVVQLGPGSLLKTDRAAGDSVDVRAGGALIGSGEIIVIDNTTGVRLSDFREKN